MFSLRGSWCGRTPQRCSPPLAVEPLEQRFAPAVGPFFSFVFVTDPASFSAPAGAAVLEPGSTVSGQAPPTGNTVEYALTLPTSGRLTLTTTPGPGSSSTPHVILQQGNGRTLLDNSGGSSMVVLLQPAEEITYLLTVDGGAGDYQLSASFDPFFPAASKLDSIRDRSGRGNDESHPFLSALVAARADGLTLGNGLLRSVLNDLMSPPPTPVVPLETNLIATSLTPTPVKAANPPMSHSLSATAVASQGALAYLPKRSVSGDALGFPTFNPPVRKPATKDQPLNFALSPFDPSGLDIVPVPVPRGLEEKLADLLGDPPSAPPDGDREPQLIRDTVLQMLEQSGTFARPGLPPSEDRPSLSAVEENLPPMATDAIFSAGTPLDPMPNQESEGRGLPSVTRSGLALLAAGLGFAGRQTEQRGTRPRQLP